MCYSILRLNCKVYTNIKSNFFLSKHKFSIFYAKCFFLITTLNLYLYKDNKSVTFFLLSLGNKFYKFLSFGLEIFAEWNNLAWEILFFGVWNIFRFLFRTTYEVAPVFVLLEKALLDGMIQLVGWEEGEGIFCPGK